MLSDIEIAQKNTMDKITDVAQKIGLTSDDLELYGDYKAKISFSKLKELHQAKTEGKVVLVTAITPTPAGEGKSTVERNTELVNNYSVTTVR